MLQCSRTQSGHRTRDRHTYRRSIRKRQRDLGESHSMDKTVSSSTRHREHWECRGQRWRFGGCIDQHHERIIHRCHGYQGGIQRKYPECNERCERIADREPACADRGVSSRLYGYKHQLCNIPGNDRWRWRALHCDVRSDRWRGW